MYCTVHVSHHLTMYTSWDQAPFRFYSTGQMCNSNRQRQVASTLTASYIYRILRCCTVTSTGPYRAVPQFPIRTSSCSCHNREASLPLGSHVHMHTCIHIQLLDVERNRTAGLTISYHKLLLPRHEGNHAAVQSDSQSNCRISSWKLQARSYDGL